ncbi:hypothetical protein HDU76_007351 [Blyttiomyces sp. JEL0837]|nr:hypothetical protein HDU76_007351 [Blyttiomyces sp. JEL0837]
MFRTRSYRFTQSTFWNPLLPSFLRTLSHRVHLSLTVTPDFQDFTQFGPAASNLTGLQLIPSALWIRNGMITRFTSLNGIDLFKDIKFLHCVEESVVDVAEQLRDCDLPKGIKAIEISNGVNVDIFLSIAKKCRNLTIFKWIKVIDPEFCNHLEQETRKSPELCLNRFKEVHLTYTLPDVIDLVLLTDGLPRAFPSIKILYLNFKFDLIGNAVNINARPVDLFSALPTYQFLRIIRLLDSRCPTLEKVYFGLFESGNRTNVFFKPGTGSLFELYQLPVLQFCQSLRLKVEFGLG